MSLANFGEPVTLVRSPMLMKFVSGVWLNASMPESRSCGAISGTTRGAKARTASAIFAICGGVVPQQPPTMFSQPASAHSAICGASDSGVSGKPVSDSGSGNPAFG